MERNLLLCLEQLAVFHSRETAFGPGAISRKDVWVQAGVISLDVLKCLQPPDIERIFDDVIERSKTHSYSTARRRVQLLSYYLRHLDRTQRPFMLENVTIEKLEEMSLLRIFEAQQLMNKVVVALPHHHYANSGGDGVDGVNASVFCQLGRSYGSSGVPLLYVVRKLEQPDANAAPHSNVYAEMIARAPLKGFYFERDNEAVWYILCHAYGADPKYESIFLQSQDTRNGRATFREMEQLGFKLR